MGFLTVRIGDAIDSFINFWDPTPHTGLPWNHGEKVSINCTFIYHVLLILKKDLPFTKQKQRRSGWGMGIEGVGRKDWKERKERKFQPGCKIKSQ